MNRALAVPGFRLALTVALFCTRSFEHDRLTSLLVEHGAEPADVDRLDVADGTAAYDDTEREPEPHNPARVYQYERWC